MWSIISAAGWPIWPLIFGSVVALAIIFERIWALRKKELIPAGLVADVCKTLPQFKDRQNLARLEAHSALGSLMAAGLSAFYKNEDIEAAMQDKSIGVQNSLEKHLDVLSMIASAAPLMGLLGTVIGMIEIFGSQSPTGSNPVQLAHGISVALYNTGFGLLIAIPSMVFWRHFRAQVNSFVIDMQQQAVRLVEVLHGDRQA